MIPPPFRYLRATSVEEAVSLLSEVPGSVLLAGGQTLVNALKLDLFEPTALIDIHRLDALRGIEATDAAVTIGAAVTYAELAASETVREAVPMLAEVCAGLVDRQVRNRGTIGGNVCLNDPTSNLPPLLAALDARFTVRTSDGTTTFGAEDFFLGTLLTAATGGMLTSITVPSTPPTTRVFYRHQQVGADSWALARVAGSVSLTDQGLDAARLFLAAVPGSPIRLTTVEAVLQGARLNDPATADAALAAFDDTPVGFIGDTHGSARFRRTLARVQLKRLIGDIRMQQEAA